MQPSGVGTVTVTGENSQWIGSGPLRIGDSGQGTLIIEDGGRVENTNATIAQFASSTGTVTVTGAGTEWVSSGDLNVGEGNTGTLTIANGARVESVNTVIANGVNSTGTVNIGAAAGDPAAAAGTLDTASVQFGDGTGTLVFNHISTNHVFAPGISGNGAIDVHSGNTLLTGESSGFTGTTTIHGGRLSVIGALGGDVDIGSGGVLRGTGTVGNLDVNGILAPGNSVGTLSTSGDVTFNAGSTYRVYVDQGGASRLDVSGDAVINGGSVEAISLGSDNDQSILGTYTIMEAGSRTGEFDAVSANYAFIDPSLNYDDTSVYLTLALRAGGEPEPELKRLKELAQPFAANGNQRALVSILDSLDQSDPRYQAFFNTFAQLTDDEVTSVLEELSGSRAAGTAGLSITSASALINFIQNARGFGGGAGAGGQTAAMMAPGTVQFASTSGLARDEWEQLAQAPTPMAGADGPTAWVRVVGQTGRQSSGNTMPGSDSRSAGLHGGFEAPVTDALTLGAALGYEQGRVSSGGMLSIDTETFSGAVYGRYQMDAVRLTSALGYARIENDSDRTVPRFGEQTAKYGADVWIADTEIAYDLPVGEEGLTLSPLVGLRYTGLRQGRYDETGAAGLSVGSFSSESVRARLGAELGYEIASTDGMAIGLAARAAWSRELASPETTMRASLLGSQSFNVRGQGQPRDMAELGLSLNADVGESVHLFAAYDGSVASSYTDHRGQVGIRFTW